MQGDRLTGVSACQLWAPAAPRSLKMVVLMMLVMRMSITIDEDTRSAEAGVGVGRDGQRGGATQGTAESIARTLHHRMHG
eukprot:7986936-Pyramimonas_sp.AAC.1